MITIFTIPKAFKGKTGLIQRNSIQSWLKLGSFIDIYLLGDDEGVRETASEFNVYHIPYICRNQYGTPFISSAFEAMKCRVTKGYLCYINTDIILLSDFIESINKIYYQSFLVTGRRWNLGIEKAVDFRNKGWENELKFRIKNEGKLEIPHAMDYFIFPRSVEIKLLPFTVGRPFWDNWFIYTMWRKGIPIIDATKAITAIHQNHDYKHIPRRIGEKYLGPEAYKNKSYLETKDIKYFCSLDATYILTKNGIKRAMTLEHMHRKAVRIIKRYRFMNHYLTKLYNKK